MLTEASSVQEISNFGSQCIDRERLGQQRHAFGFSL